MESAPATRRKTGRPLSFDRGEALHQAMLLFWRHGYEATALSDLTAAIGVTPPSIYAAFGDKKRLFLQAVDLYLSGAGTAERFIEEAPTVRDAAWGMLQGAAIKFTGAATPPGCLLASAAISCSAQAADVQEALAAIRRSIGASLARRIAAATNAGELPPDTDAAALAGHVMAVIAGMSTLARDGTGQDALLQVAATAMRAWPGNQAREASGS